MDAEAADWVWDQVVPQLVRRGATVGGRPDRTCPCQYGPCGHCQAGRHSQCPMLRRGVVVEPEARIISRDGMVATARWGVWRASGAPCRWICSCPAEHRGLFPDLKAGFPPARRATPAELGFDSPAAVPDTPPLFELAGPA